MQTARARTEHAPRTRTAPRHPRRVSGPLRPLPAGAPARRGNTGVFERLRALPEHRVLDGLLRGRAWIWVVGILLGGIVAMQVSLLKLNAGISRAVTTAGTLERQNADLEAQIARLSSSERIRATALEEGMVIPSAGEVQFLRARPERDPSRAARRYTAPSETAIAIMLNGGREPGVLAETAPVTTTPEVPDPAAATAEQAVVDPAALTTEPATAPIEPVE
jgi:cell division protein FtsL